MKVKKKKNRKKKAERRDASAVWSNVPSDPSKLIFTAVTAIA